MTQKQFVEFRQAGFWAYDVALGVFLKHLIDAAEAPFERRLTRGALILGMSTCAVLRDNFTTDRMPWQMSNAAPCECDWFARAAAEPSVPVEFDEVINEYHIVHETEHGRAQMQMNFCPFCGGASPRSRRDEMFARMTRDELDRVRKRTVDLGTIQEVIAALGPPDLDLEGGFGTQSAPTESVGPVAEYFRTLVYQHLSNTVEVRAIERPDGRVRFTYTGKCIGLPKSPPDESALDDAVRSPPQPRADSELPSRQEKRVIVTDPGSVLLSALLDSMDRLSERESGVEDTHALLRATAIALAGFPVATQIEEEEAALAGILRSGMGAEQQVSSALDALGPFRAQIARTLKE